MAESGPSPKPGAGDERHETEGQRAYRKRGQRREQGIAEPGAQLGVDARLDREHDADEKGHEDEKRHVVRGVGGGGGARVVGGGRECFGLERVVGGSGGEGGGRGWRWGGGWGGARAGVSFRVLLVRGGGDRQYG